MAYALIGIDVVMRLALVEKKVAVRWLNEDEVPAAKETASREEDTELVQPNETLPAAASDSKEYVPSPARACSIRLEDTPQEQPKTSQHNADAPKHWIDRLPPVFTLLKSARLNTALGGSLIQAALLTSFDSILPLYVRDTFHWNSIGAGLIFLPLVVPSFLGPVIGWAADRYGPRWLGTIGFILAVPCLILLRLVTYDSLDQKILLCGLLALIGVTLNLILVPLMAEIMYAVTAKAEKRPPGYFGKGGAYAQAYGLFNMAFAGGSMAGPLLAGLVNQKYGWGTTTLVLGCLSAGTALPTVIWSGGSIFKHRRRKREQKALHDEDGESRHLDTESVPAV